MDAPDPRLVHLLRRTGSGPTAADLERYGGAALPDAIDDHPDDDLSRPRAVATWMTGVPGGPPDTGWLGRWVDQEAGGDPRTAVALSSGGTDHGEAGCRSPGGDASPVPGTSLPPPDLLR